VYKIIPEGFASNSTSGKGKKSAYNGEPYQFIRFIKCPQQLNNYPKPDS